MLKVKFVGLKNISLEVTGNTILEILKVQRNEKFKSFTPIAFIVPSGSILYYDENKVNEFINSNLSLKEFVQSCQCLGLYRNTVEIKSSDGYFLDSGYLWKQISPKKLILINDDLFVEYDLNDKDFENILQH